MGKKDYEACNFFRHGLDVNRIYIMEGPVQFANDVSLKIISPFHTEMGSLKINLIQFIFQGSNVKLLSLELKTA